MSAGEVYIPIEFLINVLKTSAWLQDTSAEKETIDSFSFIPVYATQPRTGLARPVCLSDGPLVAVYYFFHPMGLD